MQIQYIRQRVAWSLASLIWSPILAFGLASDQKLFSALVAGAFALNGIALFLYVPIHHGGRWNRYEPLTPWSKRVAETLIGIAFLLAVAAIGVKLFAH